MSITLWDIFVPNGTDGMPSVAENVWLYVKGKPYLQDALEKGVVNYSALARVIDREMGEEDFDAVKAALRRLKERLGKERRNVEQKVLKVIKASRLEMRDKIAVIISNKKLDIPVIAVAKSASGYTYIVEEDMVERSEYKDFLKIQKNLSMITIISPESLEDTPGVLAYLLSSLAAENINVVEFVSCYRDTLLVFKNADITKAFEILSERLRV
ncbi:MAG: ACT domain-containing protein [Candidatus Aenigmatarchaeota archaeon]|nr:MAG: ACT domain-containing protein [Candidatus Aenigmarchaeota archaeon]